MPHPVTGCFNMDVSTVFLYLLTVGGQLPDIISKFAWLFFCFFRKLNRQPIDQFHHILTESSIACVVAFTLKASQSSW